MMFNILLQALKGGRRDKVKIATKFGITSISSETRLTVTGDPVYIKEACNISLKRLGVDCIDLYYIHRIDTTIPIEITMGALKEQLKRRFSMNGPCGLEDAEEQVIPTCRELGIGIVPFSPLVAQNESISLIKLNLTLLPDLPVELHTTNGLPSYLMATLKRAFDNATLNTVAAKAVGIPSVLFITNSATMASNMIHLYKKKGSSFTYKSIYYGACEFWNVKEVLETEANGRKDKNYVIEGVKNLSSIVLAKSFKEIEGKSEYFLLEADRNSKIVIEFCELYLGVKVSKTSVRR
ncbi:beta-D-glucosyl crocetin beta-1,6-glucosyltransferase [Tanacetum coccineum]